jgi:hypothetical protein
LASRPATSSMSCRSPELSTRSLGLTRLTGIPSCHLTLYSAARAARPPLPKVAAKLSSEPCSAPFPLLAERSYVPILRDDRPLPVAFRSSAAQLCRDHARYNWAYHFPVDLRYTRRFTRFAPRRNNSGVRAADAHHRSRTRTRLHRLPTASRSAPRACPPEPSDHSPASPDITTTLGGKLRDRLSDANRARHIEAPRGITSSLPDVRRSSESGQQR